MTTIEIVNLLKSSEYGFLRTNPYLGENIILLTLGGSHAYGTNIEGSDLDIRGCALNPKSDILLNQSFEQVTDKATDTTIYAFNKLISLLTNCNPNVIEMLGNKKEHYFHISPIGQELLDNASLFLSKKAAYSFGGYASAQLRRLDNKTVRSVGQADKEKHILSSVKNAYQIFSEKYFEHPEDAIRLYIDKSPRKDIDVEIFMDVTLNQYPLRDYKNMLGEMNQIVKEYERMGHRNKTATEHGKLSKHMMHLIRLYIMCLDILERGQIITYRKKEHDLLMDIRNGKYLSSDKQPLPEFFEMVKDYEKKMEYAKANSFLPKKPDYKRINEFVMSVNERVVKGEI